MRNSRFFDRLLIIGVVFLVMFVVAAMLSSFVDTIFQGNDRSRYLALAVVQSVVAFILPSLISARLAFGNVSKFLTLNVPPSGMSVLGVVIAYLISLPLLNQLIYWNENIVFPDFLEKLGIMFRELEDKAAEVTNVMLDTTTIGGLIVGILIIGVLTGFSEELFFRGTLQRAGASRGAHHTSIWVTALIFSAFHFQAFGFIPRLLLGAWFGYLLYWTGSIYVAVIAHALNNSMVVIFTYFFKENDVFKADMVGVTETGFPLPAFISSVAFVIFLFYLKNTFFQRSSSDPDGELRTSDV